MDRRNPSGLAEIRFRLRACREGRRHHDRMADAWWLRVRVQRARLHRVVSLYRWSSRGRSLARVEPQHRTATVVRCARGTPISTQAHDLRVRRLSFLLKNYLISYKI